MSANTTGKLRKAIRGELEQRREAARLEQYDLVAGGRRQEALENLVFFSEPHAFPAACQDLLGEIEACFSQESEAAQAEHLAFLVELALALGSLLPRWNLAPVGVPALTHSQIQAQVEEIRLLLAGLAQQAPQVAERLLSSLEMHAARRYKAEQAPDPAGAARRLAGASLLDYLRGAAQEIAASRLRRIAEMRFEGETATELSNDYAAFLQHALYLGASFATTNPPLVNMAWDILPEAWDPVADELIRLNPHFSAGELAKLFTLEVVLAQMRLLRPIFLLSEGRMGCVCFQVDPNKHADAEAMVADALFFYEMLRSRLEGGAPNVVFKLPGTLAGLKACRALTRQGIGATITVNFGMFQHVPFARAIQKGKMIFACLVEMNGRLAYPVRDELLGKLDHLASLGIDEAGARQAAAWAGVLVAKRLYRMLRESGIQQSRCKILIASLRIYTGEAYAGLPGAFPDITEVTGAALLSVFPNVRHAFEHADAELRPVQIEAAPPQGVLEALAHSEIFKQAYYLPGDERLKPERALSLEDEDAVFNWSPVHSTLVEFMNSYNSLVQRLDERRRVSSGK
jgi:transaldolase